MTTTKMKTADELRRDILGAAEDYASATSRMTNAENDLSDAREHRARMKFLLDEVVREAEQRMLEVPKPASPSENNEQEKKR